MAVRLIKHGKVVNIDSNEKKNKTKYRYNFLFIIPILILCFVLYPIIKFNNTKKEYKYMITQYLINSGYCLTNSGTNIFLGGSETLMTNDKAFELYIKGIEQSYNYFNIDKMFSLSLGFAETKYNYLECKPRDGSGLYQIMFEIWKGTEITNNGCKLKLTNRSQLFNPYENTLFYSKIFDYYLKKNGNDYGNGIYEYNGTHYKNFINKSSIFQNRKSHYILEVMSGYNFYSQLNNKRKKL